MHTLDNKQVKNKTIIGLKYVQSATIKNKEVKNKIIIGFKS